MREYKGETRRTQSGNWQWRVSRKERYDGPAPKDTHNAIRWVPIEEGTKPDEISAKIRTEVVLARLRGDEGVTPWKDVEQHG